MIMLMLVVNVVLARAQFAFFDFCAGNYQQNIARARMEIVKISPQIGIARVEAAKVALRTGFSPKCDHRMLLILWFGACVGGTS